MKGQETMKIIKEFSIIIMVLLLIICSFLSNCGHDVVCDHTHCIICQIIHFAQFIFEIVILCLAYFIIKFINFFIQERKNKSKEFIIFSPMVFQKVQLNE